MSHYFVLVLLLVLCIVVSVGLFSAFAGCILCWYICDFAVVVLCSVLPGTVRVGRRNAELSWLRFAVKCVFAQFSHALLINLSISKNKKVKL